MLVTLADVIGRCLVQELVRDPPFIRLAFDDEDVMLSRDTGLENDSSCLASQRPP
jgi:hypothetical protein